MCVCIELLYICVCVRVLHAYLVFIGTLYSMNTVTMNAANAHTVRTCDTKVGIYCHGARIILNSKLERAANYVLKGVWIHIWHTHTHTPTHTHTHTHIYIYIYIYINIYIVYMWQKSSVFSHESAQHNVAGHLIGKISLKQHGDFATNGFVFPLIRLLAAAILKMHLYFDILIN